MSNRGGYGSRHPLRPYGKFGPARVALRAARKLERAGKLEAADAKYREVLAMEGITEVTRDEARAGLNRLASISFHRMMSPRLDATFYMLGAMEKFDGLSPEKVRVVTLEISVVGSGGLDLRSTEAKYTLTTLPGQSFTGLHLLCYMYVGLRRLFADPPDIHFDLTQEYELATKLHKSRRSAGEEEI